MISVRKRIYYLFIVFSVVFIIFGSVTLLVSYTMMSRTSGFPTTEAVISSIEYNADRDSYHAMIDYSVNRRAYHEKLGYYSPSYKEGGKIEIRYDPEEPTKVYVKESFNLFMVVGAVITLSGGILSWFVAKHVQKC